MNRWMRWVVAAAAVLAVHCAARGQTTIVLRSGATAAEGGAVRLGDVAEVTGPEAAKLAGVVVIEKASATQGPFAIVETAQVQAAVERDVPGLNWGRVTLNGGRCYVRIGEAAAPAAAPERPRAEQPRLVEDAATDTVRGEVAHRLASLYNVEVSDLRMGFGTLTAEDTAFLARPLEAGVRYEVQPAGSVKSGRIPVRIDLYRRDRHEAMRSFNVTVEVRRAIVLAARTIERDEVISPEALSTDSRWVSPEASTGMGLEEAVGCTARRRIEAGKVVVAGDVQTPVVVRKGETVWVHCLSGSVALKARAKALAQGRDGEMVPMQMEGSKKTFMARMSGRGVAVMLAEEAPAPVEAPEVKRPAVRNGAATRTGGGR